MSFSFQDSNQPSATVTFVRVSGADVDSDSPGSGATNTTSGGGNLEDSIAPEAVVETSADPILMLDQEQINRLENVLRSEEAKGFLSEMVTNNPNPNESIGDFLNPTEVMNPTSSSAIEEPKIKGFGKNKRRSQRQIDRELKEEAERIRKENQELLKKEKEAMRRQSLGQESNIEEVQISPQPEKKTPPPPLSSGGVATSRPKRERKLPAHLKAGDFEYSYKGPNDNQQSKAAAAAKKVQEKPSNSEATEIEDEFLNEEKKEEEDIAKVDEIPDFEEEEDDDFNSDEEEDEEDDPNKLWCICQQPHNNRFMICCDSCSDWFHGKCVGITKKMGKEMEEAGNDWTCPQCKNKAEKEANSQLKEKLKERMSSTVAAQSPAKAIKDVKTSNADLKKVKIIGISSLKYILLNLIILEKFLKNFHSCALKMRPQMTPEKRLRCRFFNVLQDF